MALKKRPKDANQLGKLIVDISTGQVEDMEDKKPKKKFHKVAVKKSTKVKKKKD